VRPRAHLREPDVVAAHEQLDAEQPAPAERLGHLVRDVARLLQRGRAHRLRLPRFDVVARHLHVADRLAEVGARRQRGRVDRTDGQLRDLVVEIDEALDDHAPVVTRPPAIA
jgi:hypothetical protein